MELVLARCALFLCGCALPLAAQAGRTHRFSQPLRPIPGEDVAEFTWSADGTRLAYWVDAPDGGFALHSSAADGSEVSPALFEVAEAGFQRRAPRFLADGTRLLFERREFLGVRVYTVPWDGSSAANELLGRPVEEFALTSDETRLVFTDDAFTADRFVLLSRALAGGAEIVLNGPLVAGGDVHEFQLTADGQYAVYWANETSGTGIYSARVDGSGTSPELSAAVSPLSGFKLTPDSTRVVFRARFPGSSRIELASAPVDGSSAAVLLSHGAGAIETSVESDYLVSADGQYVVFRSDRFLDGKLELFSAPLDGSHAPVQLSLPMPDTSDVHAGTLLSPDGGMVAWRADASVNGRIDLYVAPSDGSVFARRLYTAATAEDVNALLLFDPAGERVAFLAGRTGTAGQKLLSAATDGSSPPFVLDDRLSDLAQASPPEIDVDGNFVVYRRFVGDGEELRRVRLDGSAGSSRLASADELGQHTLDPAGTRVAFAADARLDSAVELFVSPLAAGGPALRISPDFPELATHGSVLTHAAGAERALYIAEHDASPITTLRSVPLVAPGPSFALNETSSGAIDVNPAGGVQFLAGESRALFRGWVAEREWLFSARVDRRADPLVLNVAPQPYASIASHVASADGLRAFFLSDHATEEQFELWAASTTVPGAPVKLSGTLIPDGDVRAGFVVTPDGARAVYVADAEVDEAFELWSSDGLAAPVKLSPPLVANGDVEPDLVLAPDGTRVYFRADAEVNGRVELYGAPTDGSAPAVKLSGVPLSGTLVWPSVVVTPDGTRVLFAADLVVNDAWQLYSVDALGLLPPVSLSATLPDYDVTDIVIEPSGAHAVFYAALGITVHQAIFRVPVAGGTPVKLSHNEPSQGFVGDLTYIGTTPGFQLTPDGTRLLYLFDPFSSGTSALYVRPLDASTPAQRLNPDVADRHPLWFRVDPTSTWAYYVTGFESGYDLHRVPLDLSTLSERVTREPSDARIEYDIAFGGAGALLLYRRNPGADTHLELFGAFLDALPFAAEVR